MGVTAELSAIGKVLMIVLMFVGRVGPLTIGLAFLRRQEASIAASRIADLAV